MDILGRKIISSARRIGSPVPVPIVCSWVCRHPARNDCCAQYKDEFGVPFIMGVGGSFDVLAGAVSRAPLWMQNAGLEWSYRLYQEPRRMFWRYVSTNFSFATIVTRELCQPSRTLGFVDACDVSTCSVGLRNAARSNQIVSGHLCAEGAHRSAHLGPRNRPASGDARPGAGGRRHQTGYRSEHHGSRPEPGWAHRSPVARRSGRHSIPTGRTL